MKNKLDLPSYLVLPNVLDYYMSILTNKLNFNNFLKKYELDTNAIKLEVSFKIPLFEEVQEINSKPTEPRIFIILIINTKYLKDYNFKTLNKINDDFSSHYENIFNNALKTYLIKQVNDLESSSMNNLNAIKNIRSNLDNLETINEKKPLTDHFILFFFKEEIERLQNDLLTGKKIKSELSLKKYSNLFVHKYLLLKDVTKYINYYKVLPIVIIIIFIFISFFLFLINFSFFYKSKK